MGMTDDFEVAVEEGATIVRIGRAIFGERGHDPTTHHRRRSSEPSEAPLAGRSPSLVDSERTLVHPANCLARLLTP